MTKTPIQDALKATANAGNAPIHSVLDAKQLLRQLAAKAQLALKALEVANVDSK